MPIIQVDMPEGHDTDTRPGLVRAMTDAVCRVTGNRPETVHVVLRDILLESWGQAGMTEAVQWKETG